MTEDNLFEVSWLLWAAIPMAEHVRYQVREYEPEQWFETVEDAQLEVDKRDGWLLVGRKRSEVRK